VIANSTDELRLPQKFFIGPMDYFSILLPGALLTYLLMGEATQHAGGSLIHARWSKHGSLYSQAIFSQPVFLLVSEAVSVSVKAQLNSAFCQAELPGLHFPVAY
jgi:hypothetical protein